MQIVFEYLPTSAELTESFWCFSIPSLSLSLSFLLVGHTVEPEVFIDRAYINFKTMLVGEMIEREKEREEGREGERGLRVAGIPVMT